LNSARSVTPWTGVANSWKDSTVCKHFFPCDKLVNGNIIDVKGNLIAQANNNHGGFLLDSSEKSVLAKSYGTESPALLVSGSWETLPTNKAALFMCAGYIDNTYTTDYQIRCAIGDINNELGNATSQGWGLADGATAVFQHVAMRGETYKSSSSSYTGCENKAVGAASTGVTLAQNSYFIRYAIYQPGVQVESKFLTLAGAVSIDSTTLLGTFLDQGGASFTNAFRMSGFRCAGIALYYFQTSTVPSDYITAVNYNGALWKRGIREIYPKAGW